MDQEPPRPAVSRLLVSRYRIDGLLGAGALGTVYRGYDVCRHRMVAIKTPRRGLAITQSTRFRQLEARLADEARAGATVGDHPNLVATYDLVADANGALFLILEYVSGGSLAERIAQGSIPVTDALRLTADVARGLHAAHERGLVHGDIKPANILLAQDGRAQVGDFGAAHLAAMAGEAGTPASKDRTPLYMAPEQRCRTQEPRPAADQYALGLVLFKMVTGRMYRGMAREEAEALLAEQPAAVVALFHQMRAERPADRFRCMAEVVQAVERVESALAA